MDAFCFGVTMLSIVGLGIILAFVNAVAERSIQRGTAGREREESGEEARAADGGGWAAGWRRPLRPRIMRA